MKEDDAKYCTNKNSPRFLEKERSSDKHRDQCRFTGKCRSPAYNNCKINVTHKQSNFFPFIFQNFTTIGSILLKKFFLKKIKRMVTENKKLYLRQTRNVIQ